MPRTISEDASDERVRPRSRAALGLAGLALIGGAAVEARAFEAQPSPNLRLGLDSTIKYSTALRVAGPSPTILADINGDDGDRNFARGFISHRLDVLTELDLAYRDDLGLRISAAGWFDVLYNVRNENSSPGTFNPVSVPHDRFPEATRDLHGRWLELLDGFVFGNGTLGGMPANLRLGRHTLLWGESLLIVDNGISYAQAPIDAIKAISVPGTEAKELFLPVGQISGQLRPTSHLTLAAFHQFESRRTRVPAAGSYFSSTDVLDAGGERLLTSEGAFYRGQDLGARSSGVWGVSLRYRAEGIDTDLGLYFINFNDRLPQLYLLAGANADPAIGKIGEYVLVFPENIHLVGCSFATAFEALSLAGEVHVRLNTPLASTAATVTPGTVADNRENPQYAVGTTIHGQVSSVYSLSRGWLWDSAILLAEVGWQGYVAIQKNRAAFDPERGRQAFGLQAQLTPTYFAVLPNLDLSIPVSIGYNPWGKGPTAAFNGGVPGGGAGSVGISGEYRKVWLAATRFSYFYGPEQYQPRLDRHYVSLSVQRTF